MQDQNSTVSFCPSFSAYSSNHHLAQIASRVISQEAHPPEQTVEDFEFVSVRAHPDDSAGDGNEDSVPAAFPLFNRDLFLDLNDFRGDDDVAAAAAAEPVMCSLGRLMIAERESRDDDGGGGSPSSSSSSEADGMEGVPDGTYCVWPPKSPSPSSSSSSEADGLEGVPDGTYCVWAPKSPSPSPTRCKKSNSTGSSSTASQSKRHRWLPLRDLLRRSRSDGKQSLGFLAHPSNQHGEIIINSGKTKKKEDPAEDGKKRESKTVSIGQARKGKTVSAHEVFYIRKKKDDGHSRKSYLPYRQDLVGFFSNSSANGMGRSFSPF